MNTISPNVKSKRKIFPLNVNLWNCVKLHIILMILTVCRIAFLYYCRFGFFFLFSILFYFLFFIFHFISLISTSEYNMFSPRMRCVFIFFLRVVWLWYSSLWKWKSIFHLYNFRFSGEHIWETEWMELCEICCVLFILFFSSLFLLLHSFPVLVSILPFVFILPFQVCFDSESPRLFSRE